MVRKVESWQAEDGKVYLTELEAAKAEAAYYKAMVLRLFEEKETHINGVHKNHKGEVLLRD